MNGISPDYVTPEVIEVIKKKTQLMVISASLPSDAVFIISACYGEIICPNLANTVL